MLNASLCLFYSFVFIRMNPCGVGASSHSSRSLPPSLVPSVRPSFNSWLFRPAPLIAPQLSSRLSVGLSLLQVPPASIFPALLGCLLSPILCIRPVRVTLLPITVLFGCLLFHSNLLYQFIYLPSVLSLYISLGHSGGFLQTA